VLCRSQTAKSNVIFQEKKVSKCGLSNARKGLPSKVKKNTYILNKLYEKIPEKKRKHNILVIIKITCSPSFLRRRINSLKQCKFVRIYGWKNWLYDDVSCIIAIIVSRQVVPLYSLSLNRENCSGMTFYFFFSHHLRYIMHTIVSSQSPLFFSLTAFAAHIKILMSFLFSS